VLNPKCFWTAYIHLHVRKSRTENSQDQETEAPKPTKFTKSVT